MDYTTVHPLCASQAHQIDLHLWRGAPQNLDVTRPIQILVNQGFVVGFSPMRLQPAWSAYRVAYAGDDVDYTRPLTYHDDLRLEATHRIGRRTFGKLGGIQLNVGHMAPNEVINRQFGRLAQMETFLMSNMSPQYGTLNSGVWLKLESAIRNVKDEPGKGHVWAIVGPIFGDEPAAVARGDGKYLQVPEAYFCVIVDPNNYPYDTRSSVNVDCFIIPQNAPSRSNPEDYPATIDEVERATSLKFFSAWGQDLPIGFKAVDAVEQIARPSRLMLALKQQRREFTPLKITTDKARREARSVDDLIDLLKAEASAIQDSEWPSTDDDLVRLKTLQHTLSWMLDARDLGRPPSAARQPINIVTYHIVSDLGDRLKMSARAACNFWNRFIEPGYSLVARLETFTANSSTIARAYKPYTQGGVVYSRIEFNTKFMNQYSVEEIATTLIHEIGHSLGMGWEAWHNLYDPHTGRFHPEVVHTMPSLASMRVERGGGPGTALSHWDESEFGDELMTGYKGSSEHVLPVTIEVMGLLGHRVVELLQERQSVTDLIAELTSMVFSRQDQIREIDLTHFVETGVLETIPHGTEDEARI